MLAVPLADGVFRIPTAPADLVNSFVFCADDGSVAVVDAGFRRGGARLVAALRTLDKAPEDVTELVLTHAHMDHAGGATQLPSASVLAHEQDVDWLQAGREPGSDPGTVGGRLVNLLGHVWRRPWYAPVTVDRPLVDGELLPIGGGLRVVHTPGHTPGHVALLHEKTGVLITGDAVMNVRGLRRAPAFFCADLRQEASTRQRLATLNYDVAAFTHGAEVRTRAKETVDEFIARDPRTVGRR